MQTLSPNWTLRSLESLCKRVSSGGTPSRKNAEFYVNGANLWVKSQELVDGYIYDTDEKITDEAVAKSSAKPYPANTVLIAMYGATVGKLAILRTEATVNQAICALVVDDNVADYRFVYHALKLHRPALISKAHGAAQQNLNQGLIREFEISTPSLETQRQIAAILSAYDDLIENNARRIKVLEEMAGLIYREWFVNFRFPGHEDVPMVVSEFGGIPEGWRAELLGNVADNFDRQRKPISGKQRLEMQGKYPYYGAATILDYVNDYLFEGRYLLMGEDGTVITPSNTPMLQLVDGQFWVNNHAHVLRGKPPVSTNFLYLHLSGVTISGYITGAAQPKITQANMNRIPVVVAPAGVMERFNNLVDSMSELITKLTRKNQNLRQTRDLLLPKLISGELDVSALADEATLI